MAKFEKGNSGRPKGSPNKNSSELKAMVLKALELKGGIEYLALQADENPSAFLALVGKLLPKDVNVDGDVAVRVFTIRDMTRPRRADGSEGHGAG